jgi:hypothetical protein
MTKRAGKNVSKSAGKSDIIEDAIYLNEAAFEKEYFPKGSFEEAREQGLVEVSDGKGNWRKAEPPTRVTLNLSPAIRSRAESLDAYLRMGYQNVLKTAMLLGIKELEEKAFTSK